jgi:hypothetical protein
MRLQTDCYVLRGITWVPHWLKRGKFVSPGYGRQHMVEMTAQELLVKGAQKQPELLFPSAR